jgi:glycosyltransferase involved in cell wall biosynthesis
MIVKNESKVIERLLESVVAIIDCYCICDTGSTDGTQEIIQDFFLKRGISGQVIEAPFVDFAHSRNVALRACQGVCALSKMTNSSPKYLRTLPKGQPLTVQLNYKTFLMWDYLV